MNRADLADPPVQATALRTDPADLSGQAETPVSEQLSRDADCPPGEFPTGLSPGTGAEWGTLQ